MSRTRSSEKQPPHEVRLILPDDIHQDLKAMSAVSGLLVSQYIRALVMNHVAKTYANIEKHND